MAREREEGQPAVTALGESKPEPVESLPVYEEALEKGYLGQVADPTPNERYSQESGDWRTPETDEGAAKEAGRSTFSGAKQKEAGQ